MLIMRNGLYCTYEMVAGIHVLVATKPINQLRLMPNTLVHLHSRNGVYRIIEVGRYYFTVQTNEMRHNNEKLLCLNEDFKCLYNK